MASLSLKEQKEAFVTGHEGTTVWEILLVCLSSPVGLWLWTELIIVSCSQSNWNSWHRRVALEAVLLLFPMALCQTNRLYPWGVAIQGAQVAAAVLLFLLRKQNNSNKTEVHLETHDKQQQQQQQQQLVSSLVSCYRSTVLYLTFVAILAVDFHVFPRRFAKTEVYGYGWMDLGAGSFVVAAGLTSRRAKKTGTHSSIKKWTTRIAPLLLLGAIRLVTNKGLDYQEHVSEYGLHWNFFFTLAVISPLATLVVPAGAVESSWGILIPILLLGLYQWFLSHHGGQSYVEDAPRRCVLHDNLFCHWVAANREGILGCVGYLALYLASEHVGRFCLWNTTTTPSTLTIRTTRLTVTSLVLWAVHWFLYGPSHIRVSRRTTNATFCVWTLAHNVTMLLLIHLATANKNIINNTPCLFEAVNRHGLVVFVVSNLLTGLVNLSVNTLEITDGWALVILFAYLCAIGGVALLADWILVPNKKRYHGGVQPRPKQT